MATAAHVSTVRTPPETSRGVARAVSLAESLYLQSAATDPQRISLGYEFIQRLWLLGGVDDIFSPKRRDYFVGLELKFDDEDLKTILPFAPGP